MTQQTTVERIVKLIGDNLSQECNWDARRIIISPHKAAMLIAAEIDALTRERDEAHNETQKLRWLLQKAQAEIERLRPAAEAWEALMLCRDTRRTFKKAPYHGLLDQTFEAWYSARVAFKAAYKAVCRARARARAAKGAQP